MRLINGGFVEFDSAAELHAAHAEFLDCLALLDAPIERGLAYFCSVARSQFYFDGNKRTARLMASGMLMFAGNSALNIPNARHLEFNIALDELFNTDDATALMDFPYDCLEESSG
ncbi:Fic family protein [Corynebacterium simulans]|uniref:Fic/DOC family protein n=1 Tax=Corynebacterium simulans TaxID=146827 RepID=A0ABR5V6C5_9CORY|nr:Fic family protein [Corynebacterium simulans]KXU17039.1 fic/DOC family protein [Corynebacterium simulans]